MSGKCLAKETAKNEKINHAKCKSIEKSYFWFLCANGPNTDVMKLRQSIHKVQHFVLL